MEVGLFAQRGGTYTNVGAVCDSAGYAENGG